MKNAIRHEIVNLCIYPIDNTVSEVRFWCNDKLVDAQREKNSDLKILYL